MNRRSFLALTTGAIAGAVASGRRARAEGNTAPHPNIIFIFIDDMGYADPSCYGNPLMKTPTMDRLAAEGVRFTNFYVNSPICSPSRVAVTTGQYPGRWGIHSYLNSRALNKSRGMANYLDPKAPTIARCFKAAGYATAHFGKWHMGGGRDVDDAPLPTAYGFDESLVSFEGLGDRILPPGGLSEQSRKLGQGTIIDVPKYKQTEIYVDRTLDFIRRNRAKPFYVRLFPNDVHDGHNPAPGTTEKWESVTKNPFEQRFFAVLKELDRQLGRVIDEVNRLGLAEKTLIVLTSDNGPTDWASYYTKGWNPPGFTGPFFGRKWCLYEGGIRMPFIARWNGRIAPGTTDSTTIMAGIDLLPTFCSLAGVPVPRDVTPDGEDMSRALLGTPVRRSKPLFWQYGGRFARLRPGKAEFVSPSLAVRDGDWKLLMNPDGTEAKLFNLADDPGEKKNLLLSQRERARQLQAAVRKWARDVVGIEVTAGELQVSPPELLLAGQRRRIVNYGVKIERDGADTIFALDGKSYIDLPRAVAPEVGKRGIVLRAHVRSEAANGVVLAQGGNRFGYCLYIKDGRPEFCVVDDWKRTAVSAPKPLAGGGSRLEAELTRDGRVSLSVDGEVVATAKAPGPLTHTPGDSLQIGADTIQPVGTYDVPNRFRGTIRELELMLR